MKRRLGFSCGFALAGALLSTGLAQATTLCEIPLSGLVTTTGACTLVSTQTAETAADSDLDESATTATSSSTSLDAPDSAMGMATAIFPQPDGSMGSVGAEGFVTGGGGTGDLVKTSSGALYIGEFTANNPGAPGSDVNVGIDLGINGQLFVSDGINAEDFLVSSVVMSFAAVDSAGTTLAEVLGVATLISISNVITLFNPDSLGSGGFAADDFDVNPDCNAGATTCTVDMDTSKMVNFNVADGDSFGLFLSLTAFTSLISSSANLAAHSDFLGNTVTMNFDLLAGTSVTASTPTVGQPVPEPASAGLLLAGLLGMGFARRAPRRGV